MSIVTKPLPLRHPTGIEVTYPIIIAETRRAEVKHTLV